MCSCCWNHLYFPISAYGNWWIKINKEQNFLLQGSHLLGGGEERGKVMSGWRWPNKDKSSILVWVQISDGHAFMASRKASKSLETAGVYYTLCMMYMMHCLWDRIRNRNGCLSLKCHELLEAADSLHHPIPSPQPNNNIPYFLNATHKRLLKKSFCSVVRQCCQCWTPIDPALDSIIRHTCLSINLHPCWGICNSSLHWSY